MAALVLNANQSFGTDTTFTATETPDSPVFNDDLTITAGTSISVTAGNLTLNAGDDVILDGNASATGTLTIAAGFLDADTAGGISQAAAGSIVAATGDIRSFGSVSLTSTTNDLGTLVGSVTGSGGNFSYVDANALTIGAGASFLQATGAIDVQAQGTITLGGSALYSVQGGSVTLRALGATSDITATTPGDVIWATSGSIVLAAGQDVVFGTGGANFDNDLRASGGITITAGRDFTIDGFADLASDDFVAGTGGNVSITVGRNINIADLNGVDASVGASGSAEASVTLTTGANGLLSVQAPTPAAIFSTSGSVTANADRVVIDGLSGVSAQGAAGFVALLPVTAGRLIDLGSATDGAANTLELSDVELDRIQTPTLRIGSATAGNITITDAIGGTYSTLSLQTGGEIVDGHAGGDLSVANLALRAQSGIGSGGGEGALETTVSNLAFNGGAGAVQISNTGALTLASVDGVTSSASGTGPSTVQATGALRAATNVSAGGTLTLASLDGAGATENLLVDAGVTLASTGGSLILRAGDNFTSDATSTFQATGSIEIHVDADDADAGTGGTAAIAGSFTATSVLVSGNADNDSLTIAAGTTQAFSMVGGGGNDTIEGASGNDTLQGGAGNDILTGNGGVDTAILSGNLGEYIFGVGAGGTTIVQDLRGGTPDGRDTLLGVELIQFAVGGPISLSSIMNPGGGGGGGGGGGFQPSSGPDNYVGNDSAETLSGLAGDDTISGQGGADVIYGNQGADLIYGNLGDDQLYGGQDNDRLYGGQGGDTVFGGRGQDVVYGNLGDDVIYGNQDADALYGGQGNDLLYGGQGDDLLFGNRGDDTLIGGLGADRYMFTQPSGADLILGFNAGEGDRLDFGGQTFTYADDGQGGTLFTLSGGGTVHLQGVQSSQVNQSFFA